MTQNDMALRARVLANHTLTWLSGPGTRLFTTTTSRLLRRIQRNLEPRRLFSFTHLVVLVWVVILLWGERWVFGSKVDTCAWDSWEDWPRDARPHRMVLLADPQIIDPHSYPGRGAALTSLTLLIVDNYLRRAHSALQRVLRPDTVMFLGDLFDGGREWATRDDQNSKYKFTDPQWGRGRGREEKEWVAEWRRLYGEDYWLEEYKRFGEIFFEGFKEGGEESGGWQRGRKLVASLPGNHDLGFGAQVQVPVRDRFEAFFGDVNRVDVIGNHSFVSVDTVSLSADTSEYAAGHDLKPIYGPAQQFLEGVKETKRKAVAQELGVWYGQEDQAKKFTHEVVKEEGKKPEAFPEGAGKDGKIADLPTILLSHVPLYRDPGTPCGPKREHWPPTKPANGQPPLTNDPRNALSITAGYQYQNVLSDTDSINLIRKIGNVVHAFSGDDHDYCEVVHAPTKDGVREITVKSLSMAMGVPTPGFQMVSLWNPVDGQGRPLHEVGSGKTVQTKLCLLPNQIHTWMMYGVFVVVTLVVLALRAILVPVLNLTPFALEKEERKGGFLPLARNDGKKFDGPSAASGGAAAAAAAAAQGTSALRNPSSARARGSSISDKWQAAATRRDGGKNRWGWGEGGRRGGTQQAPRIHVDEEYYYPGMRAREEERRRGGGMRTRMAVGVVGREMGASVWRVVWMAGGVWIWLTRRG